MHGHAAALFRVLSCKPRHFPECSGMKVLLAVTGSAILLCQCTLPKLGRADGIDPNPFDLLEKQATAANHDASRIRIPVLKSAAMEKRWGNPKLLVGPKGGYVLRYEDPNDDDTHLTIYGSPEKFSTAGLIPPPYTELGLDGKKKTFTPVEVSQQWRNVRIAGNNVRYYISEGFSGDQPTQFSTETFRLTAPDGRTASYRIRTASNDEKPANAPEHLMGSIAF